jgi:hypothetical protein
MARNIGVDLEDSTSFRGVVLYLYPGIHSLPLKTYTTADGVSYQYHLSKAYGPYATRAPATSQVTQELRGHEERKYNTLEPSKSRNGWRGDYTSRGPGTIPDVTAFVEEQIPAWRPIAGTERTA